ncbi:MAG: MBL fold hydrolase [Herpetosiphon sp.]
MLFRHIYTRELAQASYLIGCTATGEALVVDPTRDVEQYIALAGREGLRVTAVTETHIHADFVSGTRELAARTGAQVYLSDAGPQHWKYAYAGAVGATLLRDGMTFMVGNIRMEALHTPGHTPEHLSFLVTDTAGAAEPMGIITGDFVFVGDVGRPDLLEKAAGIVGSTEGAAHDLYASIQRFRALPEYLQIWPGHGAGSACGRALGAVPQSTVGYERRFNWAFGSDNPEQFVHAVLDGQPAPPPYFARMKRINQQGPPLLTELPAVQPRAGAELPTVLAAGTLVVDTRPTISFGQGHIPGTINLPLDGSFLAWAGWLLPYDSPVALIVDEAQAAAARQQLHLIGIDQTSIFSSARVLPEWVAAGRQLATVERREAPFMREAVALGELVVLDVRNPHEYTGGHIVGSQNIPLGVLTERLGELPKDRPVLVHCQSGMRSAIAASVLQAHGVGPVFDLKGGYAQWQAAGNPVERVREQEAASVAA